MALLPIPSPIGLWKKILIVVKDTVVSGVAWMAYEYGTEMNPAGEPDITEEADAWRKFVITWENSVSLEPADTQAMAIEIVNITNGQVDNTWNAGDYTAVVNNLGTFVDTLSPYIANYLLSKKVDVYARAFAPYTDFVPGQPYKHFVDSGPPLFTQPWTKAGTGSGQSAPQVCSTVTEETASRKHWGRNYMPTIASTHISSSGRVTSAAVNVFADAWETLYENLMGGEYLPVVPSTMANRVPAHTLQGVTGLRVDDVPDIIRRRRYRHATINVARPLP